MTIYTGVADANGDFTVPFATAYTSGEKITVTAEKSGAQKTIELYAPSDTTGGGIIQFSGTMNDFPNNVGKVTLSAEINGAILENAFSAQTYGSIWEKATGLSIKGAVSIGNSAFYGWVNSLSLSLPALLVTISASAFDSWSNLLEIMIPNSVTTIEDYAFRNCTACKKVTIGSSVTSIGWNCFENLTSCTELIVLPTVPPTAGTYFLNGLKTNCVIKVPAASLAAYKAATNWKAYASKMVGI